MRFAQVASPQRYALEIVRPTALRMFSNPENSLGAIGTAASNFNTARDDAPDASASTQPL
jgi:hypothetical protein